MVVWQYIMFFFFHSGTGRRGRSIEQRNQRKSFRRTPSWITTSGNGILIVKPLLLPIWWTILYMHCWHIHWTYHREKSWRSLKKIFWTRWKLLRWAIETEWMPWWPRIRCYGDDGLKRLTSFANIKVTLRKRKHRQSGLLKILYVPDIQV